MSVEDIVQRHTIWETAGTFHHQSVAILAHKDAPAKLIIPMADSVQDGFTYDSLIKRWNVKNEEALLIVLFIVPQAD
ncbi:hypothetical protein FACS189460_3280 [Deltaproteobacteria bacterium]|nr:hypothetical protein FACS189460_3280 [Deltaproteobacteria bacterium]